MSLVTPTVPSAGDAANATDISTPINQLANVINGGIDDTNISSISGSKIAAGTLGTSQLTDASVTNAKLSTTAGELGGAWTTWTPTLTNFTGTVNVAKYMLVGKTCYFYIKVTQGASVSGQHIFSLPVTASSSLPTGSWSSGTYAKIADGAIFDSGTDNFSAEGTLITTTTCALHYLANSANIIVKRITSGSAPMTWANGADTFYLSGFYERA